LDTIIKTLGSVAEGVTTAKGVKKLIDELGVDAPIATGVSGNYTSRFSMTQLLPFTDL
jgi:glycerol-3-phosphate dehydrogenase